MIKTSHTRNHKLTIWFLEDNYFIICFSWEKAQVPEAQVEFRSHTSLLKAVSFFPMFSQYMMAECYSILRSDDWTLSYFTIGHHHLRHIMGTVRKFRSVPQVHHLKSRSHVHRPQLKPELRLCVKCGSQEFQSYSIMLTVFIQNSPNLLAFQHTFTYMYFSTAEGIFV